MIKEYNAHFVYILIIFFLPIKFINAAQYGYTALTDFSLSLQNQKTNFISNIETYEVESDHVGIKWYEAFTKDFQGGLEYGYLDVSLNNTSQNSIQFGTGEYYGVLFRYRPIEYAIASLTLNLNYRYNQIENIGNNQTSKLIWRKTLFSGELEFRPFNKLGFLFTAEYQNLSAEQRDSGNFNQITYFNAAKNTGYRFGINIKPNPTAEIRLEWLTGYRKGGIIHFSRGF